jgi:hypothetical protein
MRRFAPASHVLVTQSSVAPAEGLGADVETNTRKSDNGVVLTLEGLTLCSNLKHSI